MVARFLSSDPILHLNVSLSSGKCKSKGPLATRNPLALNQYLYVNANPITLVDPYGEECSIGEPAAMVAAVGTIDAWTARNLANEALDAAKNSGLSGLHNGPADAFRHCYWSCRMTQTMGAYQARIVGNIHEECNAGPPGEKAMDLFNNAVGRSFGSDCKNKCKQAACDGTLQTSP